jgi:hypothetical protein
VDVTGVGGTIIVTNGLYAAGGRIITATGDGVANRVVVDKPLTVCSVNGPEVTLIQGQTFKGGLRCVYLAAAATLAGFTLTNGMAGNGGGVYCESSSAVLTNCVLNGNFSSSYYGNGGGAYGGTLNHCTLAGNIAWNGGGACGSVLNGCTLTGNSGSAAASCTLNNCILTGNFGGGADFAGNGGGSYYCTLNNCTLTGNSAAGDDPYTGYGGGAYGGSLNNCILSGNSADFFGGAASASTLNNCTLSGNYSGAYGGGASGCTVNNSTLTGNCAATNGGNYDSASTLNYCCTTPLPTSGVGTSPALRCSSFTPVATCACNPIPPALTAATTSMSSGARTWTAIRASSAARWIWALTNIKRRFPSFHTLGSSSMACPSTRTQTPPTWMAPA